MRGMHVWSYNSLPPNKVLQGTRKRRRAPEHGVGRKSGTLLLMQDPEKGG